jgi:hypothetical protein
MVHAALWTELTGQVALIWPRPGNIVSIIFLVVSVFSFSLSSGSNIDCRIDTWRVLTQNDLVSTLIRIIQTPFILAVDVYGECDSAVCCTSQKLTLLRA